MNLQEIAELLSERLTPIFIRNNKGCQPVFGSAQKFQADSTWRDPILFDEYFHSDHGAGLGASHQIGWTGLVPDLLQQLGGGITIFVRADEVCVLCSSVGYILDASC